MFRALIDINKTLYFIFLCVFTVFLLFLKKSFLEYETTAFLVLDERGELAVFNILSTLQFVSIPVIYLFKFVIITFLLWVGSFLFGYRLTYSQIFGLVIVAETIFLLPEFIKILWLMKSSGDLNFYDIRAFYPFSLMHFFDYTTLPARFHYPVKALNLFEVLYWFILVGLIHLKAGKRLGVAYGIVFSSYTLFFLIWLWFYIAVYK